MDTKLIPGGTYTINDSCYVFIKEKINRLIFFEVEPLEYNLENVELEMKGMLVKFSKRVLNTKFTMFDTQDFLKKYDGFLGCINPWLLDMTVKIKRNLDEEKN